MYWRWNNMAAEQVQNIPPLDDQPAFSRGMTWKQQKILWGIIFLLPWLLGFIFLFAIPFYNSFRFSFFDLKAVEGGIERTFP